MFRSSVRLGYIYRGFSSTGLRLQNSAFYDEFASVLKNDMKKSMLAKNNTKKETVKMLRSELKNYQIDTKGKENNEFAVFTVINKMIKTREKSIQEYSALKRDDLVQNESAQLQLLKEYLGQVPVASEEEISNKITDLLQKKKNELKEGEKLPAAAVILKELDLQALEKEWKASAKDIRKSLFMIYKSFS